jgi:hypothetical protein
MIHMCHSKGWFTHSVPCPCRAHAVHLPSSAAKGLECVFPIWFTQCSHVWFTLAMPCPCPGTKGLENVSHLIYTVQPCLIHTCHAVPMLFFSRPWHSTAVEGRPVAYPPAFGFFQLAHVVPQRLLPEAYQTSSQQSIPTTVKSGSSTLQKRRSVKLLD